MILLIYYAIIIISIVVDLWTKHLAVTSETLVSGGSIDIIPGVLRFRLTYNDGAAMGMLSDNRWVFMNLSTVAIIGLIVGLSLYAKKMDKLKGIAFSLFIGGGIGNMVERIFNSDVVGEGLVTDFIDFCAFPKIWPWIFNFADVCVCVGAGFFMLSMIIEIVNDIKKERAEKAAKENALSENEEEQNTEEEMPESIPEEMPESDESSDEYIEETEDKGNEDGKEQNLS